LNAFERSVCRLRSISDIGLRGTSHGALGSSSLDQDNPLSCTEFEAPGLAARRAESPAECPHRVACSLHRRANHAHLEGDRCRDHRESDRNPGGQLQHDGRQRDAPPSGSPIRYGRVVTLAVFALSSRTEGRRSPGPSPVGCPDAGVRSSKHSARNAETQCAAPGARYPSRNLRLATVLLRPVPIGRHFLID
jgi:hypothetical protein